MIKYVVEVKNGSAQGETMGTMVTDVELKALCKHAGLSLGKLLEKLPSDTGLACLDAFMSGLEGAKQQEDK